MCVFGVCVDVDDVFVVVGDVYGDLDVMFEVLVFVGVMCECG